MAVVQVAKVSSGKKMAALDQLATLCFYYPQYTFAAARQLPAPVVGRLLKKARQMEAQRYYNLTRIALGPHTDKGKLSRDLQNEYMGVAKNG